jgi:hypothetical protein
VFCSQAVFILALAVLACAEEKKEEQQSSVPAEKKQDKRGIFGLGYGAAPALAAPALATHALAAPELSYAAPALAPSVLAHAPALSYAAPALSAHTVGYAAPALAHAPAAVSTQSSFVFLFSMLQVLTNMKEGSQFDVPHPHSVFDKCKI